MSLKETGELIKAILNNVKISWIGMAIIILLLILFCVIKWILSKYKKGKRTIKENVKEFCRDLINLKVWKRIILCIVVVILCVLVFVFCYLVKKPSPYQEIAILNDENEIIYPIGVDILNEKIIGEYTFFTYNTSQMIGDKIITYPVLYKWQKGKIAEKISKDACPHFEVIKNSVIYLNSTLADLSHGELYVARPDGMNKRVMEEELYDFSVDDEYIYFTYCFDTIGAGLEGHALYRIDLNGNHMTRMAYEISSPILKGSHYNVRIENGWAIYSNYKIQIENEANGLEKVVLLENTDDDWIYYTSNRLIKAKPDGTEQIVLDEADDFWYQIDKIEGEYIFYQKGNDKYKIDINGENKEKLND